MEAFLKEFHHLKIQLQEIKSATGNFDINKVIGKGGFGLVYEGELRKSMVAFKRLDRNYGQGTPEFWKEILMLSRYTHEHLISLVGFCDEDGEKILVYEHAFYGSLDRHLSSTTLTWSQRLKICLGAATGLCYLHDPNGTQQRVIHRDIKSSNILLDKNWNAKVSDMGLSKIGPANQSQTFVATNVVGTFSYIDPMYMETSILTKESDVYSFGVVLLEVLCGKLCFEYKNGRLGSLVRQWKKSYKQNKLDEIILEDLKKNIDQTSLETFSDIAYRCLKKSREKRPEMYHIVEKLATALQFQEIFEESLKEYEEICKTAVPPLVYRSKEELKMLLSSGIIVNGGKTWFMLNKSGEHCEMIPATECLIPIYSASPQYVWYGRNRSRFAVGYYRPFCSKFKTHVRTQFLSPHITYIVNLVFDIDHTSKDYISINYTLGGETKSSTLYFADQREDGWLIAELYQYTSDSRNVDLEITFQCRSPLVVEGIEFQPLKRVVHEVQDEEEVDMQTISDLDRYWELKLPSNYKDIIKLSQDTLQWTTTKDLYSTLRKGFQIKNSDQWLSLSKNGKKCLMVSARAALRKPEWRWQSLPESRFEEVAFDPDDSFWIRCTVRVLSSQTTYAIYIVYKIQKYHYRFEPPVKVSIYDGSNYENYHSSYIHLIWPQTPTIRPKVDENTHNPLNRAIMKCFPQKRNDGWMEVQLLEFQTNITTDWISESFSQDIRLSLSDGGPFIGLIVQGIHFRPI